MNFSLLLYISISFLLLLFLLYKTNHTFRYYIKFLLYFLYVSTCGIILIPFYSIRPRDVKNLLTASIFCKHLSTIFGIKWIVKGENHFKNNESCVVVSNHQSSIDILGMFDIWHIMERCTAIAKNELFYIFPFGLAAWLAGLMFIKRSNPEQARRQLYEAAIFTKANKIKLWIFPEGTRRDTGEIHEFKKGAFHVAIQTQMPILPVVYSKYYFLDSKKKVFDSGSVIIEALQPISTEGLKAEDIDNLMNKTRTAMTDAFNKSNLEIEKLLEESNKTK